MGMFDYIKCEYLEFYKDIEFQTKSTPMQFLDLYVISKDGYLYHEKYDIEDKSDPNAEGMRRFYGRCTRTNKQLEKINYTGEIVFYDENNEFSSYFINGELKHLLERIKDNEENISYRIIY